MKRRLDEKEVELSMKAVNRNKQEIEHLLSDQRQRIWKIDSGLQVSFEREIEKATLELKEINNNIEVLQKTNDILLQQINEGVEAKPNRRK